MTRGERGRRLNRSSVPQGRGADARCAGAHPSGDGHSLHIDSRLMPEASQLSTAPNRDAQPAIEGCAERSPGSTVCDSCPSVLMIRRTGTQFQ